ncbi:hypothetical protein [Clostridium baratii]|uniref:Uncharacterized protein n=1 Tax=Clostridium baratii str. Sullivan TaxID=1415775 RepID=A0A0A7FYC6_9CLOT|nr:hypothetical protein [Clostridium baratii]AIY84644.1 hypothetical protein U729_438 [Clostridium baratii str. Sullivan]MDU1054958.1 hypothetical protein [Clostridium baratii]MDU4912007.1 hypothetical protein [Clostridium baratii]CUO86118.1 Uncharacterised protein [Clostridium baratii]
MEKILKFIKNNKGAILLSIIFLIFGSIVFTSKNNDKKKELEKEYVSQQTTLNEKNSEISSVKNEIESTNKKIEDLKNYINENK